jgi:WhiB family redox-sensing transcriptional regulator
MTVRVAPSWTEQAACRGLDPELFFPHGASQEARRVCARCPVRVDCLDYAVAHRERYGIWGGRSERERRRLGSRSAGRPRRSTAPAPLAADGRPTCEECGGSFTPTLRRPQRFCSGICRRRWHGRVRDRVSA